MSETYVAASSWEVGGVWTKPRPRRRFDALLIAGLLFWGIFALAARGNALSITDGLPYDITNMERINLPFGSMTFTCTGGEFCESGTTFSQPFDATITLPETLGGRDLLLVYAGYFGGSAPTGCPYSGFQQLDASIAAGSVTNATLTSAYSPSGPNTPLCDQYGENLEALLLVGADGEKLDFSFTVDVNGASPEVSQLSILLAGYAVVPEPDSALLLSLGLLAMGAGTRSPPRRRA